MRVRPAAPEELPWLAQRTRCPLTPLATAIVAVDGHEVVRGMVGYDAWAGNCCQVHLAMDTPIAARALWGPALEYPFTQLGLGLLVAFISSHNPRSLAVARHAGFVECHRIRDGRAVGEDLVLLELHRANWALAQRRAA